MANMNKTGLKLFEEIESHLDKKFSSTKALTPYDFMSLGFATALIGFKGAQAYERNEEITFEDAFRVFMADVETQDPNANMIAHMAIKKAQKAGNE